MLARRTHSHLVDNMILRSLTSSCPGPDFGSATSLIGQVVERGSRGEGIVEAQKGRLGRGAGGVVSTFLVVKLASVYSSNRALICLWPMTMLMLLGIRMPAASSLKFAYKTFQCHSTHELPRRVANRLPRYRHDIKL